MRAGLSEEALQKRKAEDEQRAEEERQLRRMHDEEKAAEIALLSSLTLPQIILFLNIVDVMVDPAAPQAYRGDGADFKFIKKLLKEIKKHHSHEISQQEFDALLLEFKKITPSLEKGNIHLILTHYVRAILSYNRAIDLIINPPDPLWSTRTEHCWQFFINDIGKILECEKAKLELLASQETESKRIHEVLEKLSPEALEKITTAYLQLMGEFVHRGCEDYVEVTHRFIFMFRDSLIKQGDYDPHKPRGTLVGGVLLKWLMLENQWGKVLPNIVSPRNGCMPKKTEAFFVCEIFGRCIIKLDIYNKPYKKLLYLDRQFPDPKELLVINKKLCELASKKKKEKKKEREREKKEAKEKGKEEKKEVPIIPMFQAISLNSNKESSEPLTPGTPRGGPLFVPSFSSSSSSSANSIPLGRPPSRPRRRFSIAKKELE